MKIILATFLTSLALAHADEKGQLRATDRGLKSVDPIEEVDEPPTLEAVHATKVCKWLEWPSRDPANQPTGLEDMGFLPTINFDGGEKKPTINFDGGEKKPTINFDGGEKKPLVCLVDQDDCGDENKLQVDGARYFLAKEPDIYQTTWPIMGELDRNCQIIRSGSTSGDPHIHTFTGKAFDFMGGCDLVLLENPTFNNGQGITVHIRTKIRTWYSYIESVVVKIGSDTLEIKSGFEERQYWVNGEAGDKKQVVSGGYLPFTIGGFPVRFRVPKDNVFSFRIFLNDEQDLYVRSVKDFLRVDLKHANAKSFSGSTGLMGDFGSVEFMARDGKTVLEDPNDYGKEWQVSSAEPMLFHDVDGVQHPEMCAMPDQDLVEKRNRRRLGEGPVSRRAAEDACADAEKGNMEDCIEDVIATGDVEYAMEYGAV